jgi:hypothetical protein
MGQVKEDCLWYLRVNMRTITIKDVAGKQVIIDPNEVKLGPIIHTSLPDVLLNRIRVVHVAIRDVLLRNEAPLSLEQFEVGFMRAVTPEEEIGVWETLTNAYQLASKRFPVDVATRRAVFQVLLMVSMGAASEEQLKREDFQIVSSIYQQLIGKNATAGNPIGH